MLFTHGFKFILVYGAVRTKPIRRQVGKRGARGNAIVWITHFWVVHVVTYNTPILFHDELLFSLPQKTLSLLRRAKNTDLNRLVIDIGIFFNGNYGLFVHIPEKKLQFRAAC